MKSIRLWGLSTVAAALCILSMVASAGMVPTDQALRQSTADQDRARVQGFLDRTDAQKKLQSMGVDAGAVKERVERLTDPEIHELAQQLDTLPAGGDISDRNLIAILLIVLLVVLLI